MLINGSAASMCPAAPYRRKKCYFDEFREGGSEFSNFAPREYMLLWHLHGRTPIELAS